jgi:hypothetical protein
MIESRVGFFVSVVDINFEFLLKLVLIDLELYNVKD